MSNKREIAKIAREIKQIKATLGRKAGQQPLEIYNFPGSNKELEKAVSKAWPNVTYKGEDIIDFIVKFSNKARDKFEDYQSKPRDGDILEMQECYGGYDIKSDTYYMGFDASLFEWVSSLDEYGDYIADEYEESEGQGYVVVAIKNNKMELYYAAFGPFYMTGYKRVKKLGIADLRLD